MRLATAIMTSITKRVPIPRNGVDYRGKLVLAPMVRSGELPSRLLALHYGADLVWGPETVDRSMIGTTRRFNPATSTIDFTRLPSHGSKDPRKDQEESIIYRLHPELEGKRLIFQIGTSDPERAVQAARIVAKDVAGIDVNAGCPKPFSTSGGMGAALLRTPDKLCSILEALVKEIVPEFEIGISVKIRLLETPEMTANLVRKLCATGITGLTIHCRTTPMRPRERAIREQLKMIVDICHEHGVACLMNGDVENRDQADQLIKEFGADGAMIATAAEANSSCFRSQADGGLAPWKEVVEQYMKMAIQVENRWGNTKYLLGHIVPGKLAIYKAITACKSYHQACQVFGFHDLEEQAKEVDERLNIIPEKMKPRKNKSAVAAAAGGNPIQTRVQEVENKKLLSDRGVQSQPFLEIPPETAVPAQAMAV
ncbi:dihydrouridine synthase [Xylogone sp. PMI_703]|nr:dihydrouridine synthase [Xylogone sp. PMI_703]